MTKLGRVIPRLDIKGPNLIKGIGLEGQRTIGRPEEFAALYEAEGADELIVYDTVASLFRRGPGYEMISRIADRISIPLTVAGGIRSVDEARAVLRAGADKIAINTAAVERPRLLHELVSVFGSQCVIASLEVFVAQDGRRHIFTEYGRQNANLDAMEWLRAVVESQVGEVLLTAIDRDGTGSGADLALIKDMRDVTPMPLIAGGGIGSIDDVAAVLRCGADAVHIASLLHYAKAEPIGRTYMTSDRRELRNGAPEDLGNADWLNFGHGGLRSVPVKPMPLSALKDELSEGGLPVRRIEPAAGS